jgi:hypothetical protein
MTKKQLSVEIIDDNDDNETVITSVILNGET